MMFHIDGFPLFQAGYILVEQKVPAEHAGILVNLPAILVANRLPCPSDFRYPQPRGMFRLCSSRDTLRFTPCKVPNATDVCGDLDI